MTDLEDVAIADQAAWHRGQAMWHALLAFPGSGLSEAERVAAGNSARRHKGLADRLEQRAREAAQ